MISGSECGFGRLLGMLHLPEAPRACNLKLYQILGGRSGPRVIIDTGDAAVGTHVLRFGRRTRQARPSPGKRFAAIVEIVKPALAKRRHDRIDDTGDAFFDS